MFKNQLAQGLIVASTLGALVILGTACSPVTSSMTKLPKTGNMKVLERNDEGTGSDEIVGESFVVARNQGKEQMESLNATLKEIELSSKEIDELRSKAAVVVMIPSERGSLRIFTTIEVAVGKKTIKEKRLNQVKAQWTRLTPMGSEFALTLIDDEKDNARRDLVAENLLGVTLGYQELK